MKAIAVRPGVPNSVHERDIPMPSLDKIPDGKGILVKVLKVGVDATDREINDALYGNAPPGDDYLVLGHESFGVVQAVGPNVRLVKPGDYVTATVRRPGGSIYDKIGTYDMTSEETYYERGINLLHGYLTEYFVDHEDYMVRVPKGLKNLHVLDGAHELCRQGDSTSVRSPATHEGLEPKRAFVLGAGQIGLLSTLVLRLKGSRCSR
jgi:glucose 1-dehydrogenase